MEEMVLRYLEHYGYLVLFGSMVLGIVGLPVPDETLLTFTGYLISIGRFQFFMAILVAFTGSVAGMSVSFWLGRRFGLPLLETYGRKIHITPERLYGVERWFTRFGKFAVPMGYFIPGVRHLTAYFTGISQWRYRTFVLYASLGGLVWSLVFVTLGVFVGHRWRMITEIVHRYLLGGGLTLLVIGLGAWWLMRSRRKVR